MYSLYASTSLLYAILTALIFLGDEKQPVGLIVASGLIIGLYIYDAYRNKRKRVIDKRVLVGFILLSVSLVISTVHSVSFAYSVTDIARYLVAILLYVYTYNIQNPQYLNIFAKKLYIWIVFIAALSLVFHMVPVFQTMIPKMNLVYKAYGHNHIVNLLLFGIPLAYSQIYKNRSLGQIVGLLILGISLALSSSKGGWILSGLYTVYFIVSSTKFKWLLPIISIMGGVFVSWGVLCVYGQMPLGGQMAGCQIIRRSSVESRIEYWRQAMTAFQQKPLVGWGPGSYYLISLRFQRSVNANSWYAHNYPLQAAVEMGLFGLISLCLLIMLILRLTLDDGRPPRIALGIDTALLHGVLLTIFYSMFEMNLDFLVIWLLLWASFGILHAQRKSRQHTTFIDTPIPSSLSYMSLSYISVYYAVFMLVTVSMQNENLQKKYIWTALFNANSTVDTFQYVSTSQNPFADMWVLLAERLHNGDPRVLYEVGVRALLMGDNRKAIAIAKTLLEIDPKNIKSYSLFSRARASLNQPVLMDESARLLSRGYLSKQQHNRVLEGLEMSNPDTSSGRESIVDFDAYTSEQGQELLARVLYSIGLVNLSNHPNQTVFLWQLASELDPGVSYYAVEHASAIFYTLNDEKKATDILSTCKKNVYAYAHCREALEQLQRHGLPPPGSMQDLIQSELIRANR